MAKQEKLKPVSELKTLDAPGLLDEMISTFRPKDESTRKHAEDLVKNLVELVEGIKGLPLEEIYQRRY